MKEEKFSGKIYMLTDLGVRGLASVGGISGAFAAVNIMVGQLESATQRRNRMAEHHSVQVFDLTLSMNR